MNFDHYVKVLKLNLSSLAVERQGEENIIHLKTSAKNLNITVKLLSDLIQSAEQMGIYKIKEIQEDDIILVFNKSPQ